MDNTFKIAVPSPRSHHLLLGSAGLPAVKISPQSPRLAKAAEIPLLPPVTQSPRKTKRNTEAFMSSEDVAPECAGVYVSKEIAQFESNLTHFQTTASKWQQQQRADQRRVYQFKSVHSTLVDQLRAIPFQKFKDTWMRLMSGNMFATKDDFRRIITTLIPHLPGHVSEELDRLFGMFDKDNGGTVDWTEFFSALSLLLHPLSLESEVAFCFNLLDWPRNGYLTVPNLQSLVALYDAQPQLRRLQQQVRLAASSILAVVQELDWDSDNSITLDEFRSYTFTHPELLPLITYPTNYHEARRQLAEESRWRTEMTLRSNRETALTQRDA
eukprot:TRINITY_DN1405_c0_g1_i1.p1 TRINITY_DN1405_c0_g1~~TRINITY_DN1405_c0_g1_i1.p1  ORF type:complete len:334 (-),score=50.24 TRINITY_DN1405_c0_g1_i1:485-1462(-)